MKRVSLPVTWNLPVAGPNKFQKLIYLFCDLIQILNFWFLVFSIAVNEAWYKPKAWVMIELMALRLFFCEICGFFPDMCTLRHCTCSLSDDLRKVWGMKGLGPFNHCNYNLYVRFPMKRAREMKLLCLFSFAWWPMANQEVWNWNYAEPYGLFSS